MKKILVIGNFNFGSDSFNGQTSKTRDYYYNLGEVFGKENVIYYDTLFIRKNPIKAYRDLKHSLKISSDVVLLLGINAASYILPFVAKKKKKYQYSIYWSIVGGAILFDLKKQKKLMNYMDSCDSLYFETHEMTDFFKNKGFKNCFYTPCFTNRTRKNPTPMIKNEGVLRACTYARVCKEKGISEAILAVKKINEKEVVLHLDIYGEPYGDYKEEFYSLLKGSEEYIHSHDYLKGDMVIDQLSSHDMMLFPTYYPGEGFPIGIIECMTGGVPVIASDWHYNKEIVLDGKTGLVYDLKDKDLLYQSIKKLVDDRELLYQMRVNSLEHALDFAPLKVMETLFLRIKKNRGE